MFYQEENGTLLDKSYFIGVDAVIQYNIGQRKWIKEDALLKPFVSFGNSVNYINQLKNTGASPWGFSNQYGVGVQIRLAKRSSIRIESAIDQEIGKSFDTHMQHRLGFIQTFGPKQDDDKPPQEDSVPDYDNDGIADLDDHCPTIPGIQDNDGCPEDYVSAEKEKEFMDSLSNAINDILAEMNKLQDSLDYLKQNPQVIVRYEPVPGSGAGSGRDNDNGTNGGTQVKNPDNSGSGSDTDVAQGSDNNGASNNQGNQGSTKVQPEEPVYASIGRTDPEHPGIIIYDKRRDENAVGSSTPSNPSQSSPSNPSNPQQGTAQVPEPSGASSGHKTPGSQDGGYEREGDPGIVIIPSGGRPKSGSNVGATPKNSGGSSTGASKATGSTAGSGEDFSYPPLYKERSYASAYPQNKDGKANQGYYVVAISTLNRAFAERTAEVLRKTYPIVEVIPHENGFFRVGIYATRTRSEANKILKYAHEHGLPYAWIVKQDLVMN